MDSYVPKRAFSYYSFDVRYYPSVNASLLVACVLVLIRSHLCDPRCQLYFFFSPLPPFLFLYARPILFTHFYVQSL